MFPKPLIPNINVYSRLFPGQRINNIFYPNRPKKFMLRFLFVILISLEYRYPFIGYKSHLEKCVVDSKKFFTYKD